MSRCSYTAVITEPLATSPRLAPRRTKLTSSPAVASSQFLPDTITFKAINSLLVFVHRTQSPSWIVPCSIRPTTTRPRPVIRSVSWTVMRNGLLSTGLYNAMVSHAFMRSIILSWLVLSPCLALTDDPRMIATLSTSYSNLERLSRISVSSKSSFSGSFTISHRSMKITTLTPIWCASKIRSLAWPRVSLLASTTIM